MTHRIFYFIFLLLWSIAGFGQATDAQLTTQANVIRNETNAGANTAIRVGNMFNALINYKTNINYGVVATGTDTYSATLANPITTYTEGDHFIVKFTNANTGPATLNINLIGNKSIVKNGSTALAAGDIAAGSYHVLVFDGTNLQLVDPGASPFNAGSGLTKTGSIINLGGTITSNIDLNPDGNGTRTFNLGGSSSRLANSSHYFNGFSFNSDAGWYANVSGDGIFFDAGGGEDVWLRSTESGKVFLQATAAAGYTNPQIINLTIANGQNAGTAFNDGVTASIGPIGDHDRNNILNALILRRTVNPFFSGQNGIGARLAYQLHDVTAGTSYYAPLHGIASSLTDVTDGSEDSKYTFSTVVNGSETTVAELSFGDLKVPSLANSATANALYYNTANGAITYGAPSGSAITDGSGTTANGTAVDLGGTLTSSPNIQPSGDGTQSMTFGSNTTTPLNQFRAFAYNIEFGVINRTNGRARHTGGVTGSTFGLGVYNSNTSDQVGTMNGPTAYWQDGSNTNGVKDVFNLHVGTNNSLATSAGFGGRIAFTLKDGGTGATYASKHGITSSLTDATDGSEDSKYTLSTLVAGTETTAMELGYGSLKVPALTSTSTANVLFYNSADGTVTYGATPSGVTSVSGTTDRITSSGGSTPVIDIAATYVGQSSITTTGTLTSGSTGAGFTVALGTSTISGTLPSANMTPMYVMDSATPSTGGGTITLDLNSQKQRILVGSASFAGSKTIALSNTTNALVFNFHFEVTNVAATLVCPASFLMSDANWNGGTDTWTPPSTGKYEMGGVWDGTNWKVKIVGPYN
jgi:hypothetical protein